MSTFYTRTRQTIQLPAKPLGSGGQGAVYAIANRPSQVAKIYNSENRSQIQEKKLKIMLNNVPDNPTKKYGHESYAWVEDLLYDAKGSFAGFLMPKLDLSRSIILFEVIHPKRRRSNVTWEHMVHTAYNLASAVHGLHSKGYIIGDLNESNVLVTPQALVTIIDTDSMQVKAPNGRVYRSTVGKAEYTAPELQGKDFRQVNRQEAHDCFALACLIFSLLMLGRHPFAGTGGQTLAKSIQNQGSFAAFPKKYRPPTGTPPLDILPNYIIMLIQRCFREGHYWPKKRPSAEQWRDALALLKKSLKRCSQNGNHYYSSHLQHCPWCKYDSENLHPAFTPSVRKTYVGESPIQQMSVQRNQELKGQQHPLNPTATSIPTTPSPPTRTSTPMVASSASIQSNVNYGAMIQSWFGGVAIWSLWFFIGLLKFIQELYDIPNLNNINRATVVFLSLPSVFILLGTIFAHSIKSYKRFMLKGTGYYIIATLSIVAVALLANLALEERAVRTTWKDWLTFITFNIGGTVVVLSIIITVVHLITKTVLKQKNIILFFIIHIIIYALLYFLSPFFFDLQWLALANFSLITMVTLFLSVGSRWYRVPFIWFYGVIMVSGSIIFYLQPQGNRNFYPLFLWIMDWLRLW